MQAGAGIGVVSGCALASLRPHGWLAQTPCLFLGCGARHVGSRGVRAISWTTRVVATGTLLFPRLGARPLGSGGVRGRSCGPQGWLSCWARRAPGPPQVGGWRLPRPYQPPCWSGPSKSSSSTHVQRPPRQRGKRSARTHTNKHTQARAHTHTHTRAQAHKNTPKRPSCLSKNTARVKLRQSNLC